MSLSQNDTVEELRSQWKRLWQERLDDKLRAEDIAIKDYSLLFVDKGTIIRATRDFKAINFREILEQYQVVNADRYLPPSPEIGGWTKFIKTKITSPQPQRKKKRTELYRGKIRQKQQPKKGGKGWLHK